LKLQKEQGLWTGTSSYKAPSPKKIALTLWGEDKINQYDLQPGREITAHLELESREYNGRIWYTEARAWKIDDIDAIGDSTEGARTKKEATECQVKQTEQSRALERVAIKRLSRNRRMRLITPLMILSSRFKTAIPNYHP
jgi:hypothetical protein